MMICVPLLHTHFSCFILPLSLPLSAGQDRHPSGNSHWRKGSTRHGHKGWTAPAHRHRYSIIIITHTHTPTTPTSGQLLPTRPVLCNLVCAVSSSLGLICRSSHSGRGFPSRQPISPSVPSHYIVSELVNLVSGNSARTKAQKRAGQI